MARFCLEQMKKSMKSRGAGVLLVRTFPFCHGLEVVASHLSGVVWVLVVLSLVLIPFGFVRCFRQESRVADIGVLYLLLCRDELSYAESTICGGCCSWAKR